MTAAPAFPRALERVTFALALTGFLAVAVSGEVGPLTLAFGLGGMLFSRLRHRLPWTPTERQWNWSTGFVLGLCLGHWRFVHSDLLPPIVFFTTHLQVLRLFSSRTARHVLQVIVIAFAMMLLASVLTTSPLILPLIIVFGFCLLLGLILLTMRREAEAVAPAGPRPGEAPLTDALNGLINGRFFRGMAGITLTLYLLAATFFVVLPRYQGNDWFRGLRTSSGPSGGGTATAGFGQSVSLGSISRIRLDPRIVMRVWPVRTPGDPDPLAGRSHLRLRGQGLGLFDGQNWQAIGFDEPKYLAPYSPLAAFGAEGAGRSRLSLRIDQERGATPVIFGQAMPVSVTLLESFPRNISHNLTGGWSRFDSEGVLQRSITYQTDSALAGEGPHAPMVRPGSPYQPLDLTGAENPELLASRIAATFYDNSRQRDEFTPFLSTELWDDYLPMIRALAAHWTVEAAATDPVAIANAFQRRLHTEYAYTLEPRVVDERFPIAGFLHETREGHCEYFATAFVLLLRSAGIPARLATGYLSPEWNDAGRFYVVRESHAHAWAEVFAPDRGWMTYDPTPPGGLPQQSTLTAWMRMSHWLDAHRHTWYRWVIDLDQNEQTELFGRLGIPFQAWRQALVQSLFDLQALARAGARTGLSLALLAGALGLAAVALVLALRFLPRRQATAWRRGRVRTDVAPYYHQMVRWLTQRGHARAPGVTPLEFARRLGQAHAPLAPVAEVTELYYRERYAAAPLPEGERRRAAALVESLMA